MLLVEISSGNNIVFKQKFGSWRQLLHFETLSKLPWRLTSSTTKFGNFTFFSFSSRKIISFENNKCSSFTDHDHIFVCKVSLEANWAHIKLSTSTFIITTAIFQFGENCFQARLLGEKEALFYIINIIYVPCFLQKFLNRKVVTR